MATVSDAILRAVTAEFARGSNDSDIPVTALVFDKGDKLIGRGFNRREIKSDPTSHAEIEAIRDAASNIRDWRLDGMTLISSLEPCLMCSSVIREARISRVFFAVRAKSPSSEMFDLLRDTRLSGEPVEIGFLPEAILKTETEKLRGFFTGLRQGEKGPY